MNTLVGVLPVQEGATVPGALRRPGPIISGLRGTSQKLTFCHGDNLRKYNINQFPSFVSDKPVMGNYIAYGIIIQHDS